MTTPATSHKQLDWLLIDFARVTPGVMHSLVVTRDGLRLAASERMDIGLADRLSAVTSGLVSLAHTVAQTFQAGPMEQTIVEMRGGYLFVTPISGASALAVFTDRHCDIGMIGYEMTLLAERVGHALDPGTRGTAGWVSR
jgi:predicted regulator of Ras-like GTPase activity (Roadblock/LC7/MglB family)